VMVNGPDRVYVERAGRIEAAEASFAGEEELRNAIERILAPLGRRLDELSPMVDARLADGSRVNAVIPPLAIDGPMLSIRRFGAKRPGPAELVALGTLSEAQLSRLGEAVRARRSILVSGGTGAGKTTLLAALLSLVPTSERLVLVEDVGELHPVHPHVVRLEARHANVEGRGEISLADLTRQALRMRPDRIVVGECRGPEVRDLLAALNTGHAGGCATVHANTAADVPARLEALGGSAGLDPAAVALQAAAAFEAVLHVRRDGGLRHLAELGVLRRAGDGALAVVTVAAWNARDGVRYDGPSWAALTARLGVNPAPVSPS
jgi:pilus assembly protein CpaF